MLQIPTKRIIMMTHCIVDENIRPSSESAFTAADIFGSKCDCVDARLCDGENTCVDVHSTLRCINKATVISH